MSFLTGGGKATFERLLEAATSQMLLEPSWVTNLEICDCIRQQDVTAKFAVVAIQKRMKDSNPHVSKFALIVLETCVKNCGQPFHEEISNNEFMECMRNLAQTGSAPVKEQILTMLQAWNHAFRNKTQFQPILATYNLMRMEGYKFPPLNESDAMFSADAAPTWKEGEVCHLCRVKFGTFTRQHHCRACGECFCSKCSAKNSIIPKMGIEREVRVCDTCYEELNPKSNNLENAVAERNKSLDVLLNAGKPAESVKGKTESDNDLPAEYLNSALAKEVQTKPALSEEEVKAQEEDELQLAMAISLSEEESKSPQKSRALPVLSTEPPKHIEIKAPEPAKPSLFAGMAASLQSVGEDNNAELNKYFDRTYWEKKNAEMKSREPSAPVATTLPPPPPPVQYSTVPQSQEEYSSPVSDEGSDESAGSDVFVDTMSKSIEMFTDRMNTVRSKGKHIAMDSTVQSLFQSLSAMHPQLMKLIEDEEDSKAKYDAMLQKLAVIREARDSLNDMRAQYQEKVQQQELEQEMLRRMQMEQKLELMRQQKQEYLEYQRQLQIQRQQELENYQLEKLRQKQTFGMNPQYEFPEVPTHAPGSIHIPGYQPLPGVRYPEVQYGSEISLQNTQLPYKERIAVQPQAESVPEAYQDNERPPQYPGSPRQFVRPLDHEHDMPPSYASSIAADGIITSSAEYYYQNGGDPASQGNQWQQPRFQQQQQQFAPVSIQGKLPQQQQLPPPTSSIQQSLPPPPQSIPQVPPSSIQQQLPPSSIQQQLPPSSIHQQLPPSSIHQQLPPSSIQHQQQPPLPQQPPHRLPPQSNQHQPVPQGQQLPRQQLPPQQLQQQPLPQQQLPPQQLPQQQLPQQQLPPQQLPQQQLPQQQLSQQQLPQQQLPPQQLPQQQLPQQQLPQQQMPQQQLPQQQLPQQQMHQQQLPPQQLPPQQLPPQQLPPQQLPPQQLPPQQLPPQQLPPQQLPPQQMQQQMTQQQIPQPQGQYLNQQQGQMQYYPQDQPQQQNIQGNDQQAMYQQQLPQQQLPQQQLPQQQFVQQQPVETMTNAMKDLQLISFD